MIEAAYTQDVLPVWTEDEAGSYQTLPYPGSRWHPAGHPVRYPHEYSRDGTAKQLTLFHPASGEVRVKGVRSAPNTVLHPWLRAELTAILATLPEPEVLPPEENRALGTLAGRADGPHHLAAGPPTTPDALGLGQPDRPLHGGLHPLAV